MGSLLLLPLAGVLRAAATELVRLRDQPPATELHLQVQAAAPQDIIKAIERLGPLAGRVVVRLPDAEPQRLAACQGAAAVEWTVPAVTQAGWQALGHPQGFGQLQAAVAQAHALGLGARLRWVLGAKALAGLQDLPAWAGGDPPLTLTIVPNLRDLPDLPDLAAVAAAWPRRPAPGGDLLAGVRLVRSLLWPACADLPSDDVEPVSPRQLESLGVAPRSACLDCPQQGHACPGSVQAWAGQLHGLTAAPALPPPRASTVFDPNCVELRGLHLGLRRAWRLSVPVADLPAFAQEIDRLGLHLQASDQPMAAQVGGRLRPARDGDARPAALVVVARDQQTAAACLQDELDNLRRPPPRTPAQQQDDLRKTLEIHRRVGAAYGYPACCVEAFCDAHAEVVTTRRVADNAVALLRAARRSLRFDKRLQVLGGGLGDPTASPLRHLPCRFDCPASLTLAEALLADLRVHHPLWLQQHAHHPTRPALVLADGSFLWLQGRLQAPGQVVDIAAVELHLGDEAPPDVADAARELAAEPLTALTVLPGHGVRVLVAGVWMDRPLPVPPETPLAERFPVLLAFQ